MTLQNIAELCGSLLVLLSFLAAQAGRLNQASIAYLALNLAGSSILAIVALEQHSWGFLLLEGVWAAVSAAALISAVRGERGRFRPSLRSLVAHLARSRKLTGETRPSALLGRMRPELHPGEYVFTSTSDAAVPAGVAPVVTVAEEEGLTMVLRKEDADRLGLGYDYVAGWITLRVHSALVAVGLTAAVSAALAHGGLSCNVVAGFYHDHLFVPHDSAARAVKLLEDLAQRVHAGPGYPTAG